MRRALALLLGVTGAGCHTRSVQILERGDAAAVEEAGVPPSGSGSAVAAFEHSCVVDETGLFCWGRNSDGQLGLGPDLSAGGLPRRVDDAEQYVEVCAAERHTCGLRKDGSLACWGGNAKGQLGLGDFEPRVVPASVEALPQAQSVACGGSVTCAVAAEGALYCWGDNAEGELGQGDNAAVGSQSPLPVRVALTQPVRQASVGQGHVCAVAQSGELHCWGRNSNWQLGAVPFEGQVRTPTLVTGAGQYQHVAAGQQHTCAVRVDGRLFCWGFDLDGRLGLGAERSDVAEPSPVGAASDYLEVYANWFHTCALRGQGRLECWGRNAEGQLGVGDWSPRTEPTSVGLGGTAWTAVALGRFHTCGLRGGAVYCWGENNADQQLGLGDRERRSLPAWVPVP